VRANYVELVHSRPPEEMAEPERGEGAVTLDAVHRCIRDLPEEQRVALLLVAVEGLSYKEVGSVLNVPVGTVTSRIARARQAVKANMESAAASRLTSPMTACDGGHKNAK
jgi:RNA polymerase sigma-70 factor (ECF subfamily)